MTHESSGLRLCTFSFPNPHSRCVLPPVFFPESSFWYSVPPSRSPNWDISTQKPYMSQSFVAWIYSIGLLTKCSMFYPGSDSFFCIYFSVLICWNLIILLLFTVLFRRWRNAIALNRQQKVLGSIPVAGRKFCCNNVFQLLCNSNYYYYYKPTIQ